ncbi:Origin recognition complex subunit 6 [Frankliniella fusca]|uniref:Origin recognition complex subunit 6 n=1 Tax=Frankliniella fusca TaxID=407009 RepID=A0AAE1H9J3_9NEOP|nr:Origin recognition complex subunit 6 [Frankliniella fusca]KAK3916448.1 Origin recognition complex subunit 6 [Frankliniella fusca]KAK3917004.1 Origin recognition complex subunit 6 [Frankliniella fusca]KAK3933047.1 Origin recognition complex subunit 6 [Frankliniella fusca]
MSIEDLCCSRFSLLDCVARGCPFTTALLAVHMYICCHQPCPLKMGYFVKCHNHIEMTYTKQYTYFSCFLHCIL